jgi:hypothetical protein
MNYSRDLETLQEGTRLPACSHVTALGSKGAYTKENAEAELDEIDPDSSYFCKLLKQEAFDSNEGTFSSQWIVLCGRCKDAVEEGKDPVDFVGISFELTNDIIVSSGEAKA